MGSKRLIYTLCSQYRLGSAHHLWTVGQSTLQQMKASKNLCEFSSAMFEIAGLSWYIEVYPNGHEEDTQGIFDIFVNSADMPSDWKYIECCIQIECIETMTGFTMYVPFEVEDRNGWWDGAMLFSDIQ